jgi:addiction module RelB/DinJ family antitoxin
MKTAVINIKTDPKIKTLASSLAGQLGLSLSQVIHISLQNFVNAGAITASLPEKISPKLEKALKKVEADLKNNKASQKSFKTPKAMDNYLNSL